MKSKRINLIWGIVLVLLGGLFLLENLNVIPELAPTLWSILFGAVSVIFFAVYAVSGVRYWGWLIPAFIFGGLAGTIYLAVNEANGVLAGAFFMGAVSLPFWVIFLIDRQKNWWALIPGWATAVITAVILLSESVAGEWIGALVMFAIGLPFFVVYFRNRQHWWALIPGFIMTVLGFVVLLATRATDELVGALFLFAIGLPFIFVYLRNREQWWALIPSGILTTLALVAFLSGWAETNGWADRVLGGILFVGFGVTFGLLWLLRERFPTDWAKYPAVGLLVAALVAVVFGSQMELLWPVVIIVVGVWLLFDSARRPRLN